MFAIRLVLDTIPSLMLRMMPFVTPGVMPRSSAVTMSRAGILALTPGDLPVEPEQSIDLGIVVPCLVDELLSAKTHGLGLSRALQETPDGPSQILRAGRREQDAVIAVGEELTDRRQFAADDGEAACPILEHLRGDVLHELGDRLQGDQSDAPAPNPGRHLRVRNSAAKLDLGIEAPALNPVVHGHPSGLPVGVAGQA